MFRAINVSKQYQEHFWTQPFYALKNVSFEVAPGSITGFLGANGAGKTTFTKILLDLIKADSGHVEFIGEAKAKRINDIVGFLPERPYFYPHLTGRDLLYYMSELSDAKRADVDPLIDKWSKILKIDHALDKKLKEYSKGMLQRAGFISSFLHNPDLVVLDEPLAGLDPMGRKEFKDTILQLSKEGKTIFMSSHIISDVEEICTHVIVLDHGELVKEGPMDKILAKDQEKYRLVVRKEDEEKLGHSDFTRKGRYLEIDVDNNEKDKLVRDLVERGCSIEKIVSHTPSLEEVIYGYKQNQ